MVTIARINGFTRIFGKDQEDFIQLPIRDELINGFPAMTSAWELSPKEIRAVMAGGKIYITIVGEMHPPIMVKVEEVL